MSAPKKGSDKAAEKTDEAPEKVKAKGKAKEKSKEPKEKASDKGEKKEKTGEKKEKTGEKKEKTGEKKEKTSEKASEKVKEKDESKASDTKSVPTEQMVLSEAQVLPSAKDTKEKLLIIHDEYKERLDKLMNNMDFDDKTTEDEQIVALEEFSQLKILLGRIQLGVYDSHLLITLVEYLQILESCRSKLRLETRRLAHENNVLRRNIQALQEDIFDKEAELSAVHVERDHWMFMCNMAKVDAAVAVEKEEQDAWDSTIDPEMTNECSPDLAQMTPELKAVYEKMALKLLDGKVKEAVSIILTFLDKKRGGAQEAILLSLAARHCTEKEMFDDSLNLLYKSLDFRLSSLGDSHESVIATYNNIALIQARKENMREAAEYAYCALKAMEKKYGKEENTELAKQYLRTGFLLTRWNHIEDGIKLMELAVISLECLLPDEEVSWYIAITKLARCCNDNQYYDDALFLCCEALDYFHESALGEISETNKPIYEIAAEHQAIENNESDASPPDLPPDVNLPETIVSILRELAIVFSTYFLFTSAHTIDKWLEDCQEKADPRETVKATDRVFKLLGKDGDLARRLSVGKGGTSHKPKMRQARKGGCLATMCEKSLAAMPENPGKERILETGTGQVNKLRKILHQNMTTRLQSIFRK